LCVPVVAHGCRLMEKYCFHTQVLAWLKAPARHGILASVPAAVGNDSCQDGPMKSGFPWTQRSRTYRKRLRMHCCTVKILKFKSHTETAGGANGATPLVLRESSTMSNA